MASPEVSSNPTEFQKIARAAADLQQTVDAYRQYTQLQQELSEAKEMAAESAGALCCWRSLHTCASALPECFLNTYWHSMKWKQQQTNYRKQLVPLLLTFSPVQ